MEFIQCSYLGQLTVDGRRFDGLGRYTFANGDVYIGGMEDGQFHGNGVIFFRNPPGGGEGGAVGPPASANPASPTLIADTGSSGGSGGDGESDALQDFLNPDSSLSLSPEGAGESLVEAQDFGVLLGSSSGGGGGQYRGVWEHGRHVEGHYVFQDGLVYGSSGTADMSAYAQKKRCTSWTYCHGSDRRLWQEYLQNVAPVLPHEALLGGARLLHARKHHMTEKDGNNSETPSTAADGTGEGLPMVLPRAFVKARVAPAFARGQLTSIDDPRITRWVEATTAAEERASLLQQQPRTQHSVSTPGHPRRPTLAGGECDVDADLDVMPELVESRQLLQFAMAVPTEGLRADGRLDDDDAETDVKGAGGRALGEDGATVAVPAAPQPALNLTVCRVLNVEDVNRALVQIVAPP
ncbi:hypothetical protein JKF63_04446 [Porcisia hertigi]|uniref:MORN repeat-containing protein 5 n=1 Tax=Porcisia hertigi TaxID=2761500 RepID=A0A836I8V9_9TRYP|nr:hypothetical protein JKF63_04446 [Porcisia hertigi]